ncbi:MULTISPECIES: MATE family efflux transporter [Streptomyces]|uniref:MATE family efflux transporter n=1 Tax=Streptomyces TaxID=1883 RepID=UPI00103C64C5|nr:MULTISPECIES: MATE family efflux transporter [Streptomyces]MBT3073212.1 MATE family efflux transporter [Streptomyces sp. COG21]MBT3081615.1 MATE family efflux transporter [Streptomyces sp. COG20]MBT3085213.1 MATE family efflux transporter [Streptomyces sp. CYG21]MBT3096761.1 MATE family efflux transporter [Streptomyces sp. CBG30]MBT3105544.1 MATE family efflux transporter [Streptomyces sp. COG19]
MAETRDAVGSPARSVLRIAVPMLPADLVAVLVPLAVLALMGRIDGDAHYVRALFMPVQFLFLALIAGIGASNQVAAAVAHGAGDLRAAGAALRADARIAAGAGAAFSVLLIVLAPLLGDLMGISEAARAEFTGFLRAIAPASALLLGPALAAATLRGCGLARQAAAVTLLAALTEIGGVALLALGAGLGIAGVAPAVALSGLAGTALGWVLLRRAAGLLGPGAPAPAGALRPVPVRAAVRRLTAVGVPVGASYLVICAANLVLMRILAPFGPSVQSGYANAATLQTLLIIPGLVLGSATAIVLNSHRGAGRSGLLSPTLHAGLRITAGAYAVLAAVSYAGRGLLAGVMSGDAQIAAETARYLQTVGLSYLLMGLVLAALTVLEQVGGGPAALAMNAVYFVGAVAVGGWLAAASGPDALYRTIAAFNGLGAVAVGVTVWFVRRLATRETSGASAPDTRPSTIHTGKGT